MTTVTSSWLQSLESLREVPVDQLQWLIDNSDHYTLAEGEFLFRQGSPASATYIVVSGMLLIYFMIRLKVIVMYLRFPGRSFLEMQNDWRRSSPAAD